MGDRTVRFGELLAEPLRNGLTRPKRVRGAGAFMVNMGELFRFDRIGDIPMDRVLLAENSPERDLLVRGDLLFARQSLVAAGAGKVSIFVGASEPVTFESHLIRARPNQAIVHSEYLYWFFRSPQGKSLVQTIVNQVGAAGIRGSELVNLPIPYPPTSQQRAIASVLGALDDKIESNRRLVSRQREVRAARYRHVVRDADSRQALREIAVIGTGTIQPSLTPDAMFEQFSIPAFDAGEDPDICAGATMASGKTALPAEPVVLLSKLNPRTPRVWNPIATGRGVPVCSPEFVVLAPAEAVSHAWLETCVRSDGRFYDEVLSAIGGTTGSRQRVKPGDVLSATVPVVSTAALRRWTSFAAPLIARESALDRERRTLTGLREALLPKLVSGRIRVAPTREEQEVVETVAAELEKSSTSGY